MFQALYMDGPLAQQATPLPGPVPEIRAKVGALVYTYARQGQSGAYRVHGEPELVAPRASRPRRIVLPDVRPKKTASPMKAAKPKRTR